VRDLYVECASCEVFGYCTQTEAECHAYFEGFGWDRSKKPVGCNSCTISMCAQTAAECEAYKEINGVGQVVFADAADQQDRLHKLPANLGLMNWFTGVIERISTGDVMALVTIRCGEQRLTSMLPLRKLNEMQYKVGDTVSVAIKAVNVVLMR
jgi:molybdopterin-binding protein